MPAEVVLRALEQAWITLEKLNLPTAVMGGLALAAWKHVRATRDVDLLVGIGNTDLNALLQALAQAKIRPKREPAVVELGQLRLVQLLFEPPGSYLELQIDLLLAESEYQLEALARRLPARLPAVEIEVSVLTCEDLVLHKLLAGRLIDRADAAALLRANRDALDHDYLFRWARTLALVSELKEVWAEAFPGQSLPGGGANPV
jgi:hypothetical protein